MITKLRKTIAFHISLLTLLFSFGLIKPDFSGTPTSSPATDSNISTITMDVDKDAPASNSAQNGTESLHHT